MEAGAIAIASGVLIDGGPEPVGLTVDGGGVDAPPGFVTGKHAGLLWHNSANHTGLPLSVIATSKDSL